MSESSSVVGEGTYGCVHKPPLNCSGENRPSSRKVTKLMKDGEAKKELKEYNTMIKVDPKNKYYLGTPKSCKVDINTYNKISAEKCKKLKSSDYSIMNHLSKYTLLVMENGGDNLEDFSKIAVKWSLKDGRKKMYRFWLEAHRAFMGVKAFLDHGVIHHDLKPQNIVYNEERVNFIDFGLMKKKRGIVKKADKSEYGFSQFHWSFPLECKFLNKNVYNKYAVLSEKAKHDYIKNIANSLKGENEMNVTNAIKSFLYYATNKSGYVLNQEEVTGKILSQFSETLLHTIKPGDAAYKKLVDKCLDTIDVYGLGLGLLNVVRSSYKLADAELIDDLANLFLDMTNANVMDRMDINTAINRYEAILEKHGILQKFNKHFNNHELVDGSLIPVKLEKKIEEVSVKVEVPSPQEMKELLVENPDALEPQMEPSGKECPEGKERHPKTRRCVKKCKAGESRNEKFECRKTQRKWKKRKAEKTPL